MSRTQSGFVACTSRWAVVSGMAGMAAFSATIAPALAANAALEAAPKNLVAPEHKERVMDTITTKDGTRIYFKDWGTGVSDLSRISPDNWVHDQALLDRPGNGDIQLDLFRDYGTNVPLYPEFHAFFRKYRPPTLIVWGKNDKIFPAAGAGPYLRDLPKAELHLLDTGHFALEDKLDVMAPMIHQFLDRSIASK
jgi:pimeloyl-ACP methyl ester carboxylesterase